MDKLRKEIKSVVKQHLHKKMGSGLMSTYQEQPAMGSGYHTGYKKRIGSARRRSVSRHSRVGSARRRSVSRHSRMGSARLIGLPAPKLYKKVGGVRRQKSRKLHSVKMGSARLRGARMSLYRKSRVGSAKYAGGKKYKKSSRRQSVKGMALRRKHSVRYM